MASLFLIRHAQASYGSDDYDQLSRVGETQANALGMHGRALGLADLDALYAGPLRRQHDTARIMTAVMGAADATALPDLAEYPAFEILRAGLPALLAEDPSLAPLATSDADPSALDRAFAAVISRWCDGTVHGPGLETFASFAARVHRGISAVIAEHSDDARLGIVTSGGPISLALARAVGAPPGRALASGRLLRNASISEFRVRARDRTTGATGHTLLLVAYNQVGHLPADLHTLR